MLYDVAAARELADAVDPAHFRDADERQLFLALAHAVTEQYDVVSFCQHVRRETPRLADVLERVLAAGEAEQFPVTLARDLARSFLADGVRDLVVGAHQRLKSDPAPEIKADLERALAALDAASLDGRSYDDKHAMVRRVERWLDGEGTRGLSFGLAPLDRRVVPLLPGNLLVVGGSPGSGKSTVIRNFLRNWVSMGEHVALFSLEMGGDEQLPNLACMDGGLDYESYFRNTMSADDKAYLFRGVCAWRDEPRLTLNERGAATPEYILGAMKRYRAHGATVLIIDHMHRVTYSLDGQGEIRLAVAAFVRSLKSFAVDYQCIVVAGAQYTKRDATTEPHDDNLREAAQIAEEADRVLHVWRPRVAGQLNDAGVFRPTLGDRGLPILERDAPKTTPRLDLDPEHVYVKIGKQRIRPIGGTVIIPFNAMSGRMYDVREWDERATA